jgi:hypothetical protein
MLRIPELGPSLGKLVTGTRRVGEGISLDANRCQLATKMMEMAGETRRLAANDERDAALGTLGRDAWMMAWEEAVAPVSAKLVDYLTTHLEAEADAVRMPRRAREKIMIDETERRAIGVRMGSSGARLIPLLDEIETRSVALQRATRFERGLLDDWQRAQTAAARGLEAVWLELEQRVDQEFSIWRSVADEIARWRKPLWPVMVTGVVGVVAALWGGLVMGGLVVPPAWMSAFWQRIRFQ